MANNHEGHEDTDSVYGIPKKITERVALIK